MHVFIDCPVVSSYGEEEKRETARIDRDKPGCTAEARLP